MRGRPHRGRAGVDDRVRLADDRTRGKSVDGDPVMLAVVIAQVSQDPAAAGSIVKPLAGNVQRDTARLGNEKQDHRAETCGIDGGAVDAAFHDIGFAKLGPGTPAGGLTPISAPHPGGWRIVILCIGNRDGPIQKNSPNR
jgi:hypothetical protein